MFFERVNKYRLLKIMILLFLILMLFYPGATYRGASSGLLLWFHNVLPNLLPFIIISNLIIRLNITRQISRFFRPILGKLFRISGEGCYPIIFGFLSGIPMGAKTTADLVIQGRISLQEGQFLIGMCNNASPMFILGFIAIAQLQLPQIKYPLFAIIYASSILGALVFRLFFSRLRSTAGREVHAMSSNSTPSAMESRRFSFAMIDESIMNGFNIVTRIGGYIILFSILAQIIKEMVPSGGMIKAVTMGILEITTGIGQICSLDLNIKIKIVLVTVLTTFGGLSGIAQTKSVLQDSRLSVNYYILVKLMSASIALLLSLLYLMIIP